MANREDVVINGQFNIYLGLDVITIVTVEAGHLRGNKVLRFT